MRQGLPQPGQGLFQGAVEPPGRIDQDQAAAIEPERLVGQHPQLYRQHPRYAQALQAAPEIVRRGLVLDRVPEGVDAGGPACVGLGERLEDTLPLVPALVGGVDVHQAAPLAGRQPGPQCLVAVAALDPDLPVALELAGDDAGLAGVQFAKHHAVLMPEKGPDDAGRAGVPEQLAAGVGGAHGPQVGFQGLGNVTRSPQALDAGLVLAVLAGPVRVQPVAAGAGMGVDEDEGLVLVQQGADDQAQHPVLEDIGMVAGMEGVTVAQHEGGR